MTIPGEVAPLNHGGDLRAARKLFPNAPEPFIDLSAGINPHPYPVPEFRDGLYARLPEQASLLELKEIAAKAYGTPSPEHVAIAPGSQILVAQVGFLLARGRACVLTPTYAEHARVAELAGHSVVEVAEIAQLADARIAIVVNPNNPDGRIVAKDALLVLASTLPDTSRMYGKKDEVDPVRFVIGAASAWGANPPKEALYLNIFPKRNDGSTVCRLNVKDVPVDGFWSVSVYNTDGYFQTNPYNVYSLNNLTARKNDDGSVTIQFGGCDGKIPNCLPTMKGWNYMVRLYRPRAEIREGKWKFPEAQPDAQTRKDPP